MASNNISIYITAPDTEKLTELRKRLSAHLKCALPPLGFRMNASPHVLFFVDLQTNDVTDLRKKLTNFQHKNPFSGIFLISHERKRKYTKCC